MLFYPTCPTVDLFYTTTDVSCFTGNGPHTIGAAPSHSVAAPCQKLTDRSGDANPYLSTQYIGHTDTWIYNEDAKAFVADPRTLAALRVNQLVNVGLSGTALDTRVIVSQWSNAVASVRRTEATGCSAKRLAD